MKSLITKEILISTLLLLGLSSSALAETALPVSTQVEEEIKIELVPEIKIQAQSTSSNPKLKEGKACSDENLEEAKGELITVVPALPMAKTMPCENVDCSDLKPARMDSYIIRKLPPAAKTISCAN